MTMALVLGGCPLERAGGPVTIAPPQPLAATHSALVSIQDIAIANLPQAGHGLTVQAFFTAQRAPDFIEPVTGTPFGCQASAYDLADETPPAQEDHGTLEIAGLNGEFSAPGAAQDHRPSQLLPLPSRVRCRRIPRTVSKARARSCAPPR